jgi:hypothetical protein
VYAAPTQVGVMGTRRETRVSGLTRGSLADPI